MDPRFHNLANSCSHPFKTTGNLMDGGVGKAMLPFDPLHPPFPQLQISGGLKHKFGLIYWAAGQQIGSSLALGLDQTSSFSDSNGSSTVCPVPFSAKETDEESSRDFLLDLDLNLDKKILAPKKPASFPGIDLELSLCTGSPLSEITDISTNPSAVKVRNKTTMPSLPIQTIQNLSVSNAMTATCTTGISKKRTSGNTRTCEVEGCKRGARGASGRCISHGGGRRCQRPGCPKGAEGRTPYCKAHGGGRRCEYLGCTKSAEGCTDYCIRHGGGRRCTHDGCTKAARGKSGLCIRHGGGKRCQEDGCTRSAEGLSGLCISHGGGRRCQHPGGCTKGAQGRTAFCKSHGGGRRCTYPGCGKGAEGSTPFCKGHGGGKRCLFEGGGACSKSVHGGTNFCVAHGGGKRCVMPECNKSARGRTAFCVRHGGGKRCRAAGCEKSAQGSTDFCKAHGGGRRCSWNREGDPCTAFARGRTNLCAVHNGMVQEKQCPGAAVVGAKLVVHRPGRTSESAFTTADGMGAGPTSSSSSDLKIALGFPSTSQFTSGNCGFFPSVSYVQDPEGRVHGASFYLSHSGGEESPMVPQGWI